MILTMKRIWLFVPDIFLSLLIVMSFERVNLEEGRKEEVAEKGYWSYAGESSSSGTTWNEQFAAYKGKAKQLLEKLNLDH